MADPRNNPNKTGAVPVYPRLPYEYDALGRLIESTEVTAEEGKGLVQETSAFRYSADGRLLEWDSNRTYMTVPTLPDVYREVRYVQGVGGRIAASDMRQKLAGGDWSGWDRRYVVQNVQGTVMGLLSAGGSTTAAVRFAYNAHGYREASEGTDDGRCVMGYRGQITVGVVPETGTEPVLLVVSVVGWG